MRVYMYDKCCDGYTCYMTALVKMMGGGGGWGVRACGWWEGGGPYQSHEAFLKWNLALNYHFSGGANDALITLRAAFQTTKLPIMAWHVRWWAQTHSSPAKEVKKTCVHNYCIMLCNSAIDILHRSRGRRPGSEERERERERYL